MAMAFQALPDFFPTQAPIAVGRIMVRMVRGNCSEPATVFVVPMTLSAPTEA